MKRKKTNIVRQIVTVRVCGGGEAGIGITGLGSQKVQPGDRVLLNPDLEFDPGGWVEEMRPLLEELCEVAGRNDKTRVLSVWLPGLTRTFDIPEQSVRLCIRPFGTGKKTRKK